MQHLNLPGVRDFVCMLFACIQPVAGLQYLLLLLIKSLSSSSSLCVRNGGESEREFDRCMMCKQEF